MLDVLILHKQEDSGIRNLKKRRFGIRQLCSAAPLGISLAHFAVRASPALLKMFALALCINQRH